MNADHLKPAKYMKNDKDLIIEELKVRAQPLPSVWAHMHVGNRISTGRSHRGNHAYHRASQHLRGWTSTSDHGTRHGTLTRRSALNNMSPRHGQRPARLSLRACSLIACVIDCLMTTWSWCVMSATLSRCAAAHPGEQPQRGHPVRSVGRQVSGSRAPPWRSAFTRRLHGRLCATCSAARRALGVERRRQLGDEWQRQRPFREQPAGARSQVVQCGQALAAEYLAYLERRGRWLLWAS